jgi:hypothetical protein
MKGKPIEKKLRRLIVWQPKNPERIGRKLRNFRRYGIDGLTRIKLVMVQVIGGNIVFDKSYPGQFPDLNKEVVSDQLLGRFKEKTGISADKVMVVQKPSGYTDVILIFGWPWESSVRLQFIPDWNKDKKIMAKMSVIPNGQAQKDYYWII